MKALYQFIKRVRLERCAWRLKVEKEKSISEIGVDSGYSSSNFATAFKKHLSVSPTDFRKKSEQLVQQSSFAHGISLDELEQSENLITVEQLESSLVVYERKKGNYHNLPEQWCRFIKSTSIFLGKIQFIWNPQLMTRLLQMKTTVCMSCARQSLRITRLRKRILVF